MCIFLFQEKLQSIEKVTFIKLQATGKKSISVCLNRICLSDKNSDEIVLSQLWTVNGLSLLVSQCDVRSIHFSVEENAALSKAGMGLSVEIYNSSFGSLRVLHPRTETTVTDCYIDAKGLFGPTLISAFNGKIKIHNGYFANFRAVARPTIIKAWSGSRVVLDNTTIFGSYGNHGVIRLNDDCLLNITGSKIARNSLVEGLSTLMIQNGVKVTLRDSVMEGNEAFMGGTLLLLNSSVLECINTTFRSNSAVCGGAILAQENTSVSLINCSFFGNVAKLESSSFESTSSSPFRGIVFSQGEGGAIMMDESSKLSIRSGIFSDNYAQTNGGAIYASRNSSVAVTRTKFMANMVFNGGAILLTTKSEAQILDSKFTDNVANASGGAVCLLNNVVGKMSSCYMKGNRAQNGGFLYSNDHIEMTIKNSLLKNNTAVDQGGCLIAISACGYHVLGSTFKGNSATNGGVAYSYQNISLTFNRCKFMENEGRKIGGVAVVFHQSSVVFSACNFSGNSAQFGGVAMANCYSIINFVNSQFSNNQASDGAVTDGRIANIVVKSSYFVNNVARERGGAFSVYATVEIRQYCNLDTIKSHGKTWGRLDIKDSYFKNNTATLKGGCISGYGTLQVQIDNCEFLANTASFGGVLHLEQDGKLNISSSNFTGNLALFSGGVIYLRMNTAFDCKDSFFMVNAAHAGASVCAAENVKVHIVKSNCSGKAVIDYAPEGSSLHFSRNAEVVVDDSNFFGVYNNVVAVVLKNNVKCKISNSNFVTNSNYNLAGAMVMENNVTCNIESNTFLNNSGREAGTIDISDKVTLFIRNSTFWGNVIASNERNDTKGR